MVAVNEDETNLSALFTARMGRELLKLLNTQVFIPNLLSQNSKEGSLLDQQSLSLLHILLTSQQQNQTLPICQINIPHTYKALIKKNSNKEADFA